MIKRIFGGLLLTLSLVAGGCREKSTISINLPERFDGKQIELISFEDSVVLAGATVKDGHAEFVTEESDSVQLPLLAQLVVDGRVRGFYVIEPGAATLDSTKMVKGTPLNDRMSSLMERMNEADAKGMDEYVAEAEKIYNENRDNVLGSYFGIEWIKYADPTRVDSLLKTAPASLSECRRARYYINFARLRAQTAPGRPYVDFPGEDASGKPMQFSQTVRPGKFTLVDFMASWCPYCVKDFPALEELYSRYADKGLQIVSVAVRDKPEDTAAAVKRHGIKWDVVYNAQKRPYDIYGFSGIPHYMLIGPDGRIIARSETLSKVAGKIADSIAESPDNSSAQ